jgi:hypothetical protein
MEKRCVCYVNKLVMTVQDLVTKQCVDLLAA